MLKKTFINHLIPFLAILAAAKNLEQSVKEELKRLTEIGSYIKEFFAESSKQKLKVILSIFSQIEHLSLNINIRYNVNKTNIEKIIQEKLSNIYKNCHPFLIYVDADNPFYKNQNICSL